MVKGAAAVSNYQRLRRKGLSLEVLPGLQRVQTAQHSPWWSQREGTRAHHRLHAVALYRAQMLGLLLSVSFETVDD